MRRLSFLPAAFAMAVFLSSASPLPASSFKVVTFGDSLTAPRAGVVTYTDQLRQRFGTVEFVNKGVGGNDTGMAAQRFARDVLSENPQLVIMQFGINDSTVDVWKNPPQAASRVSAAAFEKNLRRFITDIRAAGGTVILMTPGQIRWTDQLRKLYGKPPYDPESEKGFCVMLPAYVEVLRKLAAEYQLPLIDVYAMYDAWEAKNHLSCASLLPDGMHPNTDGHRLVADALQPEIERLLEKTTAASGAAPSRAP